MEADAIFALLVRADERMKYAREGDRAAARAARDLLARALDAARAAALPALVEQAEMRLADLAALGGSGAPESPDAGGTPGPSAPPDVG